MAAELVRQLDRLGVEVDVGVFDNAGRADRTILEAAGGHIRESVVVPCTGQMDWSAVRFLREYVGTRRINVLHSHKYKTTFYGLCARRGGQARLVATYHNWLTDTMPLKLYTALDKCLARFCDAAIGVSAPVVQELKRYAPAGKVFRIGNGVDAEKFRRVAPRAEARRRLGLPDNVLLGFVGRLSEAKGLVYLLRALPLLPQGIDDVHVAIVGDGDYRAQLLQEISALGLAGRIHLLGTRRDTPLIYSALDVFVLPSFVEAFPMVLLEAMACGVPVVATAVGDTEHIVHQEVSGLVVPPGDAAALAGAIGRVLADHGLAARFAAAGPPRVQREFSSAAMARAYLALYERTLAAKPAIAD